MWEPFQPFVLLKCYIRLSNPYCLYQVLMETFLKEMCPELSTALDTFWTHLGGCVLSSLSWTGVLAVRAKPATCSNSAGTVLWNVDDHKTVFHCCVSTADISHPYWEFPICTRSVSIFGVWFCNLFLCLKKWDVTSKTTATWYPGWYVLQLHWSSFLIGADSQ